MLCVWLLLSRAQAWEDLSWTGMTVEQFARRVRARGVLHARVSQMQSLPRWR
jgi:hypothetical protein